MADEQLTPEQPIEPKETDMLVEFTSTPEYLASCFYAISAVEELDATMYNAQALKKRVMKRCLRIIDTCVKEMYDELFEEEQDD